MCGAHPRVGTPTADQPPDELPPGRAAATHVVRAGARDRVARHARVHRVLRVLHDRDAACGLDGGEAERTVVERAGQDHADDAVAGDARGRAEERVDRGPVAVHARAAVEPHHGVVDEHVVVGRRHVDPAVLERAAVLGVRRLQRAGAVEDPGQHAGTRRRDVEDDEDARREIGRESGRELLERLDASRRRPHDDEVPRPAHTGDDRARRQEVRSGRIGASERRIRSRIASFLPRISSSRARCRPASATASCADRVMVLASSIACLFGSRSIALTSGPPAQWPGGQGVGAALCPSIVLLPRGHPAAARTASS